MVDYYLLCYDYSDFHWERIFWMSCTVPDVGPLFSGLSSLNDSGQTEYWTNLCQQWFYDSLACPVFCLFRTTEQVYVSAWTETQLPGQKFEEEFSLNAGNLVRGKWRFSPLHEAFWFKNHHIYNLFITLTCFILFLSYLRACFIWHFWSTRLPDIDMGSLWGWHSNRYVTSRS